MQAILHEIVLVSTFLKKWATALAELKNSQSNEGGRLKGMGTVFMKD